MKKIVLLVIGMLGLASCAESETAEVTGRLAMKGTSIHTYMVIEDIETKKALKINNYRDFNLLHRQNETVTLKVKLVEKAVGPGFPAVVDVVEVK